MSAFVENDIERFDDEPAPKERDFVTALARGLELLRCFGPGDRHLGLTELARRTGIPKASVSRLAGTLTKLGYLSAADGHYSLGAGILALGYAMLSRLDVRHVARPLMEELAEHSRASVSIGIRDRMSMVYIESVRSSAPVGLQHGLGARLPIATTSIGRAYLAALPEPERNFLLDQIRIRSEADWARVKAGVEQALRDYEKWGFCLSIREWNSEIVGVGVPFDGPDNTMMAFNCGCPAYVLSREQLIEEVGPRLVKLVNQVGYLMGRPSK